MDSTYTHLMQHCTEHVTKWSWTQEDSLGIQIDPSVPGTWRHGGATLRSPSISEIFHTIPQNADIASKYTTKENEVQIQKSFDNKIWTPRISGTVA